MSISVSGSGPSITVDGSGSTIAVTVTTGGGSSSGVTDHGALTGLSDDDHSLYALADGTRGTFEVAGAVSTHSADTTSVHGITDTSVLATGPASATDSGIALFDGTGGKTLKDSAVTISTDDTFASDSDSLIPTEQAVKAYVDNNAGGGGLSFPSIPAARRTFGCLTENAGASSAAWIADRVLAHWMELPAGTIDEMALHILSNVASSTYRLGIYLPDDTDGLPGTLVVAHAGTLSGASTGEQSAAVSQAIDAGGYWGVVQTGSTAGATSRTIANSYRGTFGRASGDVFGSWGLQATRSDAALPADLSGTSWSFESSTSNNPHGLMVAYA
jgi:hypothetical protein